MNIPLWIKGQIGDTVIAIAAAALLITALVFAYVYYTIAPTPEKSDDVAHFISEFGKQIESVPLNDGTQESIEAAMDALYTPYVSPALLASWKKDPSHALGRYAASPRPVGIHVSSVKNVGIGAYIVKAYVKEEVKAAGETTITDGKRILLGVTLRGKKLQITEYQEIPQ